MSRINLSKMKNVYNFRTYIFLLTSLCLRPYISNGEECSPDGYYKIPRFGSTCQYRCRCYNEEQCDRETGSCENGCAFGWMGPGCQYRNIAPMNSGIVQYNDSGQPEESAYLSTDGDHTNCSKSYRRNETGPWWRIDFTTVHYVVGMIITTTKNAEGYIIVEGSNATNFQSNALCYQGDSTTVWTNPEVMCRETMTVKHIRITALASLLLELCEVEIYGGRYVSYKGSVNQTSYFSPWPMAVAGAAVDGRPMLDGDIQDGDASLTCAVTYSGASEDWRLHFSEDMLVQCINVYGRRLTTNLEYISQIAGFKVHVLHNDVQSQVYWDNPPSTDWRAYQPRVIELVVPRLASSLKIAKRIDTVDHLSLCEVDVFAECKEDACGWDCSDACHCNTVATGSYRRDGVCPYGCKDMWTGEGGRCDKTCPYNRWGVNCVGICNCNGDEPCDFWNGTCPRGCAEGWTSPACNIGCSGNTHGRDCIDTCGNCKNNEPCDTVTGHCDGCEPGWHGLACKDDCPYNRWGVNCVGNCNCYRDEPCDFWNGTCPRGCAEGWTSPACNIGCSGNTHGRDCIDTCGNCKNNEPCDTVTGHCDGCEPGWHGLACKDACPDFYYGHDCNSVCGTCQYGTTCDKQTGQCEAGCIAGKMPPLCKEDCPSYTYGQNCKDRCGICKENQPCNVSDGVCHNGCEAGYHGNTCILSADESSEKPPITQIIAGIGGGLVVCLVIVIVLVVVRCRRRNTKSEREATSEEINLNQVAKHEYDDLSHYEDIEDNQYLSITVISEDK